MNRSHVFIQIANFLTAHWTNHLRIKYLIWSIIHSLFVRNKIRLLPQFRNHGSPPEGKYDPSPKKTMKGNIIYCKEVRQGPRLFLKRPGISKMLPVSFVLSKIVQTFVQISTILFLFNKLETKQISNFSGNFEST